MSLRYVGDGAGLSGFPARDLSNDDLKQLVRNPYVRRRYASTVPALVRVLLAVRVNESPLYSEAASAKPAANTSADDSRKEK